MQNGGARPGSGRKAGGKNRLAINTLAEILNETDMVKVVKKGVELAKKGDKELIKYFCDQYYGKALQSIEHSGTQDITGQFNLSNLSAEDLKALDSKLNDISGTLLKLSGDSETT